MSAVKLKKGIRKYTDLSNRPRRSINKNLAPSLNRQFLNYDIILRWGFSVPQLVFYVCKKKAAEGDRVGYACTPPSNNQLFIVIRVGAASLTPATDLSDRQAKSVVCYSSERVVFL
ncbi:hypothetical protein WA026_007892 [Henosepilachna vigintioctopunctata]|uniref:Uncharacterized protein n=1 Tax=Henosepilachna vigintioctopunctata TaxID=420089 RepID=A0AAW1U4A7_9CUCU